MTATRQQRRAAARRGTATASWFTARRIAGVAAAAAIVAAGVWWWWAARETVPPRDGAPGWTPDGQQLVYYSEQNGKADLFIVDRSGGNRRPLTRAGPAHAPALGASVTGSSWK